MISLTDELADDNGISNLCVRKQVQAMSKKMNNDDV